MKIGYLILIKEDATYVFLPGNDDDSPIKKLDNSEKSLWDKIEDVKNYLKNERGVDVIEEPEITSKTHIKIFGNIG